MKTQAYTEPELVIVQFSADDVIVTSIKHEPSEDELPFVHV